MRFAGTHSSQGTPQAQGLSVPTSFAAVKTNGVQRPRGAGAVKRRYATRSSFRRSPHVTAAVKPGRPAGRKTPAPGPGRATTALRAAFRPPEPPAGVRRRPHRPTASQARSAAATAQPLPVTRGTVRLPRTTRSGGCRPGRRRRAVTPWSDRPSVDVRLTGCTDRSRSPPAERPGRSRCRTASSRCRRSRRPSTSRPWPPRSARPGCCGSGTDPYRPG